MIKTQYRMYGLVPYNLSPIQQGIQFGHAVVEYGLLYASSPSYQRWAQVDKTFIILNGGTTNKRLQPETEIPIGTLNQQLKTLNEFEIRYASFYEPDLGDQLTAVVFLISERIWDLENYTFIYNDIHTDHIQNPYLKESMVYREWITKKFGTLSSAEKFFEIRKYLQSFRLA